MRSPSAKVRLALISEPNPSAKVAGLLSTDLDAAVAFTARWQLEHLDEPATAPDGRPDTDREPAW